MSLVYLADRYGHFVILVYIHQVWTVFVILGTVMLVK